MLSELEELDDLRAWPRHFQRLNWEASQRAGSLKIARRPENRQLNRYRDVLPYDHSRVVLKEGPLDYINANLVEVPRLNKQYILTQGPLPNTAKHFWQMVWEQETSAIIMLNRVVEKNQIKCYQYWPCGEVHGHVDQLEFGNFRVSYVHEMRNDYFAVRSLELQNLVTEEKRDIHHFHYMTWPDFGVPTSPATFLAFLFEVRKTGALSSDVGPAVIHCSAGIGRSGTLIMVDTVLAEIEKAGVMDEIDIKQTLLEMRRYRVGLIQTPDQLRFTYLAILEGVQLLMPEIYQNAVYQHLQTTGNVDDAHAEKRNGAQDVKEQDDVEQDRETPPPLPPRRRLDEPPPEEPATKKSRPDNGMSLGNTSVTLDRSKNKSKFRGLLHFMSRRKAENKTSLVSQNKRGSGAQENAVDREVLSDSSDGSDEIINLSSLSESESEDDSVQKDVEKNPKVEKSQELEKKQDSTEAVECANKKEEGLDSGAAFSAVVSPSDAETAGKLEEKIVSDTITYNEEVSVKDAQVAEEELQSDDTTGNPTSIGISTADDHTTEMAQKVKEEITSDAFGVSSVQSRVAETPFCGKVTSPVAVQAEACRSVPVHGVTNMQKVTKEFKPVGADCGESDSKLPHNLEGEFESKTGNGGSSVQDHRIVKPSERLEKQFKPDTVIPTVRKTDKQAGETLRKIEKTVEVKADPTFNIHSNQGEDVALKEKASKVLSKNLNDKAKEENGSEECEDHILSRSHDTVAGGVNCVVQVESKGKESNEGSIKSVIEHNSNSKNSATSCGLQHQVQSLTPETGAAKEESSKRSMDLEKEDQMSLADNTLQLKGEGQSKDKESDTDLRRRKREERKRKTADLVESIKKKIKQEEEGQAWKSRLKTTLLVVAACSVAYIALRCFTSG